ncbi:MAG: hypothetical protein Q9224_006119, partial [Gallowayella concinna]
SALPFNCTTCARDTLYHTRLSLAYTLLEHEAAGSQVEQAFGGFTSTPSTKSTSASSTVQGHSAVLTLESINVHREALRQQTQLTLRVSEQLRGEATQIRDETGKRKARNLERRSELAAARKELARREADDVGSLEKTITKVHGRWCILHTRTAESRLVLCKEAASLYGLRKLGKHGGKSKMGGYVIGGLPIYNVMDLNNADPANITAINSTLAHLIHLTSHYLSLRLPAEVILPHGGEPFPTILLPGSSYASTGVPFSTATLGIFAAHTHAQVRAGPGARPLSLKKHLPTVAKDDSQTYAAVVEGITLLAWNVAWLCKTQGIDVGAESWEEMCDVGKNLGMLFAAEGTEPRSTSSAHGPLSVRDAAVRRELPVTTGSRAPQPRVASGSLTSFGRYSHGTVHSNLSAANGAKTMRGWRLQDPAKTIERVKQILLGDRTGAGWDMLEGKEWEAASPTSQHSPPAAPGDASTVVVDSTSGPKNTAKDSETEPNITGPEDPVEKGKGTSGWTKLKNR